MKKMKKQKGFTLIELMVVISIIGLLASVVLVALNDTRKKGRDTVRVANANQIVKALDFYFDKFGSYPDSSLDGSSFGCNGWSVSNSANFLKPLLDNQIIGSTPKDPINNGACAFNSGSAHFADLIIKKALAAVAPSANPSGNILGYQYYAAGTNGCPAARGNYYVLGVKTMETVSAGAVYPGSPGFSCPGKDWQTSFSWVTGKFEK
jgi:prepilin-type N-terminal cleavage/methylation domain-containing protein